MTQTTSKTRTITHYTTTLTPVDVKNVPANGIQINMADGVVEPNKNRLLITDAGLIDLANDSVYRNFVHSVIEFFPDKAADLRNVKKWGPMYLDDKITTRELLEHWERNWGDPDDEDYWDWSPSYGSINDAYYHFQDIESDIWNYARNHPWTYRQLVPWTEGGCYKQEDIKEWKADDKHGREQIALLKSVECPHVTETTKTEVPVTPVNALRAAATAKKLKKIWLQTTASKTKHKHPMVLTITEFFDDENTPAVFFKEGFYSEMTANLKKEISKFKDFVGVQNDDELIGIQLKLGTEWWGMYASESYLPDSYKALVLDIPESAKLFIKALRKGHKIDADNAAKQLDDAIQTRTDTKANIRQWNREISSLQERIKNANDALNGKISENIKRRRSIANAAKKNANNGESGV